MYCMKCKSRSYRKHGYMNGKQRYICKDCGYQFTTMKKQGYSKRIKNQAIQMSIEGMGLRGIGRVLGISHVTVMKWIKKRSEEITIFFPQNE
jgi:transposase-like protein